MQRLLIGCLPTYTEIIKQQKADGIVETELTNQTVLNSVFRITQQSKIQQNRPRYRFHWAPDEPSDITRAIIGLNSSPFLLGGVIEQHLWETRATEVVAEIRKSMYVDDLISGKTTVKGTQQLKKEATEVFQDAYFALHKWHSNFAELEEPIANVTGEQSFAKQQLGTPGGGDSSILGLAWNKRDDEISVVIPEESATPTKRGVLRKLASTHDPLGFASPAQRL